MHLRMINLGETVIPMSKYGISLDHLARRGLNFDLGGKTPLGRKDKPYLRNPYDLIASVAEMLHYLKNEEEKMEHMDKLLPFILENTCYVHRDKELHKAYVRESSSFLLGSEGGNEQKLPPYKARALKKLVEEGVTEMDYSKPGASKKSQRGDLADFSPKIDAEDVGRLYDVKQEIYRLA